MDLNELEIPEDLQSLLRTALGKREDEPLPAKIVDKFWELKRCHDRLSCRITPEAIAMFCFIAGAGKALPQEAAPPSVVDLYRRGKMAIDEPVEVLWRNERVNGVFKGITGRGEAIVQLDGSSEERHLDPKLVIRATAQPVNA